MSQTKDTAVELFSLHVRGILASILRKSLVSWDLGQILFLAPPPPHRGRAEG